MLLLHKHFPPTTQATPICATLTGSDACNALGIVAHGNTPVLGLCRKLIDAGHNPAAALHAYRGDMLCLIVHAIGEAARLEINSHGTGFIALRARRTAPPMRRNGRGRA